MRAMGAALLHARAAGLAPVLRASGVRFRMYQSGQTLVEKIVQKHLVDGDPQHIVRAGDFVSVRPSHIMTHDNTAAVMIKYV